MHEEENNSKIFPSSYYFKPFEALNLKGKNDDNSKSKILKHVYVKKQAKKP